jgi:HD domain
MTSTPNSPLDYAEQLSLARNLTQLVDQAEALAREVSGASQACLYRYELSSSLLFEAGSRAAQDPPGFAAESILPGRCALEWELQSQAVHTSDAARLPGFEPFDGVLLSLPVLHRGTLRGVLSVGGDHFDDEQIAELAQLARVLALMVESAASKQDIMALSNHMQAILVPAIESCPGIRSGHIARIASLVSELGTLLDLSARSRQLLWQAAHYHDVGKLKLQGATAWEIEQRHTQVGAELLAECRPLAQLAPLVASHHERYDGSGFPEHKKGDELPLEAWVLSLAEDLEEYCSQNAQQPIDEVLRSFFEQRQGSHHPLVLDALCGLTDNGRLETLLGG